MIYIWDNGGSYSDHSVEFIESDLPREDVETMLLGARGADDPPSIVGVAETIAWREGRSSTLDEWAKYNLTPSDLEWAPSPAMLLAVEVAKRHGVGAWKAVTP